MIMEYTNSEKLLLSSDYQQMLKIWNPTYNYKMLMHLKIG